MRFHKIFIAALVLLAQPTVAQFVAVEDAVETSADSLVVPVSVNGDLVFESWCPGDCEEFKRVRLTPATAFFIDGKAVKFDEFRKRFSTMRVGDDSYALVVYDVKANIATRVMVNQ